MINKKYLKLLRTRKKIGDNNFINDLLSKRIIDSLDLIKIPFDKIIEIGVNDDKISNYLYKKFKNCKIERVDSFINNIFKINNHNFLNIDIENLILKENSYDLIYSNNFIYMCSDLEKILSVIHAALKPKSFFIATIPNIENFYQLKNCMYRTDLKLYNGAYQRFVPSPKIDHILQILKKLRFEIPAINTDRVNIEYKKFQKLLQDIKSTNISYHYIDKKKEFENKRYFAELEKEYLDNYNNGNFELEISFNIVSGWKN